METYIPISFLKDFIFCPRSIYFHQLYGSYNALVYQQNQQIAGKAAHTAIDEKKYSTRKNILQGIEIWCEKYKLCGKIDVFDVDSGKLVERKRKIKVIYDGYIFQVYAHYHALTEMGYEVKQIAIYDITHNKSYPIALPPDDHEMQLKLEKPITDINALSQITSSSKEPFKFLSSAGIEWGRYRNKCGMTV